MRDHLQQIAPAAFHLSQRDEGAAQVVAAPVSEAKRLQVDLEVVVRIVSFPHRAVGSGNDQIVGVFQRLYMVPISTSFLTRGRALFAVVLDAQGRSSAGSDLIGASTNGLLRRLGGFLCEESLQLCATDAKHASGATGLDSSRPNPSADRAGCDVGNMGCLCDREICVVAVPSAEILDYKLQLLANNTANLVSNQGAQTLLQPKRRVHSFLLISNALG